MKAGWIYPFIILGGVLQTFGAAMNGQLNKVMVNPFLASAISFALITAFFMGLFAIFPTSLPSLQGLASMHGGASRRLSGSGSGLCGTDLSE